MKFIEYISATGSQWINADIKGSSNITFKATYMETLETSNWRALFGSRIEHTNQHFSYYYSTTTAGNNCMMGCNNNQIIFSLRNNYINKKTNIEYTNGKLTISDGVNTEEFDHSYSSSFTNNYDIHIFNMNNSNTNIDTAADIRLYKLEFYSNGTLVRDFYPAKDDDGVPCLFDNVSKTFFYNSGTGTFGAGTDVSPEYKFDENVMLTGQTAYFKKNGSMRNYGVITSDNQEVTNTYGPGFIDEGSTIGVAKLETSQDYVNTLNDMRIYLSDDFISESEDYLVKANAENISTQLSTRNTALQNIASHIDKYIAIPYIKTKTTGTRLDMLIPLHLEENFVLEIKSDLQPVNGESYMLIDNGDTFQLSQNSQGVFFLNGVNIGDLSHTTGTTMVISQEDGHLYIEKDTTRFVSEVPGFDGETDIVLNTQFASRIDEIKVYGDTGITDELMPRYDAELRQAGLHDLQNNLWYTSTNPITLHGNLYSQVNIYYGALDLGYVPGPNTGVEVKYAQYGSQSTSRGTYRGIIGCYSEASITGTVHFGILLGSGSQIYATRNDNIRSWVSSGVANTVSGTGNWDIITVNKNNDGRFKCSGAHNFNVALSGTVTQTGPKGNTLWLNGYNDLGQYIPLQYINNQNLIRGGQNDIYIGYVKIYEGNELVRYYIPGYDLNNSVGMYDIVEQKMYKATKCSFSISGSTIDEPPL